MPVLKRLLAGVDVRVDLVLAPEGEDCGSAVNLCFASMKHVAFRTDPDIMSETACSEPGATVFGIHNTTSEILCLEQMRGAHVPWVRRPHLSLSRSPLCACVHA